MFKISYNLFSDDFVYCFDILDKDQGQNSELFYNISGRDVTNLFIINSKSGEIRAKNAQNLSSIDSVELQAEVQDKGWPVLKSSMSYRFYFHDADYFPVFDHLSVNKFSIFENQTGFQVVKIQAKSPKSQPANRIIYSVACGDNFGFFTIHPTRGILTTTEKLDFDILADPNLDLWISASDSDNPSLTSFLLIQISLKDVNDNEPVFSQPLYEAKILEEQDAGVEVLTVQAKDVDSGANGQITYSIADQSTKRYFSIDPISGTIKTTVRLDREQRDHFRFKVQALDNGNPQKGTISEILILLDDINDNAPKFTRLFSAEIYENAKMGTFLTRVTSVDPDTPKNANTTYVLMWHSNEEKSQLPFKINRTTGEIRVWGVLDRESRDHYSLKVAAMDGTWRVETTLNVAILDVNDNAPIFDQSIYM